MSWVLYIGDLGTPLAFTTILSDDKGRWIVGGIAMAGVSPCRSVN